WHQRNSTFFNALQVERNVMFLILTLIVLVAALNIVSGLIMLVKDKGSDIAILRTMGASQGSIMRIFLITGASIGVVGTLVGFVVGTLICLNIESIRQFLSWMTSTEIFTPELYFLSTLPAELHIADLLEHPDEGEVYLSGTPTSSLSDIERTLMRRTDIGFVYQSHRLLPEFSALENVMIPQMVRGLGRKEAIMRATELLAYLGL